MKKYLLILFSILIPTIILSGYLLRGDFAFWYDPARDLLTALDKPTLIGPTSGIPGIFYGAYWIWLLRFGLLFSKDPILVTLITATIPYLLLCTFIWFRFTRFFSLSAVVIGWLFFIFGTGMAYATGLWNPYPAPLLTVAVIYLLLIIPFSRITKKTLLQNALLGLLIGLIINFHISFGIALLCGVVLFLIKKLIMHRQKNMRQYLLSYSAIAFGFVLAYIPALLFELRHGFSQTHTLLNALGHFGNVVETKGLSKSAIFQEFFITLGEFLHISTPFAGVLLGISLVVFMILVRKKKITLDANDRKILDLIGCLFIGIIIIYFTAKNPIWAYHFIGVDILFLVLIAFLLDKMKYLRILAAIGVLLLIMHLSYDLLSTNNHPSKFERQKQIVTSIIKDAGDKDYAVFAYSPSIYIYEYSYLFKWLADKDVPYDPAVTKASDTMYLIVPDKTNPEVKDFINNRAPEKTYKKSKTWEIPQGGKVIKVNHL